MDFGRIYPGSSNGTASIPNSADTITCPTGGVCTGSVNRGEIIISGSNNMGVNISYTNGVLISGTDTMALDINNVAIGNETSTTLSASGEATIYIGGLLTVASNQASGSYSTSNPGGTPYVISVDY